MGTVTYLDTFRKENENRLLNTQPSYDWINDSRLLKLTEPGIIRNALVDMLRQAQVDTNSLAIINDDRRAIVQLDKKETQKEGLTRVAIQTQVSRIITQLRISYLPQVSIDHTRSSPHILQLRLHLPETADFPRRPRMQHLTPVRS